MNDILELIRAHGCLEYAQAVADEHAMRGLATLEAVLRDLAGSGGGAGDARDARVLATRSA
ncbi:MAG: hypothetical protein HC933_04660 [Pleurocapsa sp. SU_196_0]|nr:hypothetical protein [Pleurocapsa sp. SU_196_0]